MIIALVDILELQKVYQGSRQELGISVILDTDLLQHLANQNLDMLITDFYTLQTVYTLYLTEHVILNGANAFDSQDIMGIHATFGQLITGLQNSAVHDLDTGTVRDQVSLGITGLPDW